MRHVAVLGGGLAGARAAQALREQGFDGRVTLVGAEDRLPYDRPPLSKDVLLGLLEHTTLGVDWEGLGVDLVLGRRAVRLDAGRVELDDGRTVPFDGLVLAVGSAAIRLPGTDNVAGVHVLRTVDDAHRLRADLSPGARVVIVGAGWIGAEVATAARTLGCDVTVLEMSSAPLSAAFGAVTGPRFAAWYADAGVALRTGIRVESVDAVAGRCTGVRLSDGTVLAADVVLAGMGARPELGWLAGTPLAAPRAIPVDDRCATAVPGIVAVGDCAAFQSGRCGQRLHVEHWDNALKAPDVAVATLLGVAATYDPVPYFWSDQLGHRVQYVGHPAGADQVVERGSPDGTGGWALLWLAGSALVAALVVDRPRDLIQARKAIAARTPLDGERLADLSAPLVARAS